MSLYHNYACEGVITYSPRTLPLVSTAWKGIEGMLQVLFGMFRDTNRKKN